MPSPRVQVLVCTNERPASSSRPCCAARGGLAVYRALKDEIRSRGLRSEVLATRTGCLRHCSLGITVACWPENQWFGGVEVGDIPSLLDRLEGTSSEAGSAAATNRSDLEGKRIPSDAPWE